MDEDYYLGVHYLLCALEKETKNSAIKRKMFFIIIVGFIELDIGQR